MYVVEYEDEETGEQKYKAFDVSGRAVDFWSTVSAQIIYDVELTMLPKIFKAKTNDPAKAIALTRAGEADFFDFGGLQTLLGEVRDRGMLLEGEPRAEQVEVEADRLMLNPAFCAVAKKAAERKLYKKK
jgi:hypothetical protein